MILHTYFARRFFGTFLGVSLILFALIVLVDLVDQSRRFSEQGLGFAQVITLALLNAPQAMAQILPLTMILSTIALFVSLARTSELIATRAAGRSGLTALLGPISVAMIIGLLATAMLNPIVAATSKKYTNLSASYQNFGTSVFSISSEGLWLRQGSADNGQTVIRALQSNGDGSELYDVTFVDYSPFQGPVRRIEAKSAQLENGAWRLTDAKIWPLELGANPEASAVHHDVIEIASTLTRDRIRDSFGKPGSIAIWDLPDFIQQLEQSGFSARQHRVWMQSELAAPLFLVAMVLVASAFTMRHTRFGGTGIAVLLSVLLGFTLYFIRSFAIILGENGQIPIIFAAWSAPVASVLLALGLVLHSEEG